jgi:hypothetical protein
MQISTHVTDSAHGAVPPQNMYAQLRQGGAAGSMVSWRRMFDFLLSICQLYSDIEADTRVGGKTHSGVLSFKVSVCHCIFSLLL